MTPYTRKHDKKAEAERLQNTTPADGETSNEGLKNTIRIMVKEMLAQKETQEKAPEEHQSLLQFLSLRRLSRIMSR